MVQEFVKAEVCYELKETGYHMSIEAASLRYLR